MIVVYVGALLAAEAIGDVDVPWTDLFGAAFGVSVGGAILFSFARITLWSQFQLAKAERGRAEDAIADLKRYASEVSETRTAYAELESRYRGLSERLDEALQAHRDCEAHLTEHKIDAARSAATMQARLDALEAQLSRPYRSGDTPPDQPADD